MPDTPDRPEAAESDDGAPTSESAEQDESAEQVESAESAELSEQADRRRRRRRTIRWSVVGVLVLLVLCTGWVALRALQAKSELERSLPLISEVKAQISAGRVAEATTTARRLAVHVDAAREDTGDPIWRAAEVVPVVGGNLRAVRLLSEVAADLTDRAILPLAREAGAADLTTFAPTDGRVPVKTVAALAPALVKADAAVQANVAVVRSIDTSHTIGPVTRAVTAVRSALGSVAPELSVASRAARILPSMLGANGPRNVLVVVQNNAEARSSGGIVGALALVHIDDGRFTLARQASDTDLPILKQPVIPLSKATRTLYKDLPGEYIQDTTMTPDFPETGRLVKAMWERQFGGHVDAVLSIDPVALSEMLAATGPVDVGAGTTLTSQNVVQTLLSDTYARFDDPDQQNAFFAGAAAAIFGKVAGGSFDARAMLGALAQGAAQRRIALWSVHPKEEAVLDGSTIAGQLAPTTASHPRVGVYLNDGTGAKMDYYLKRAISVAQESCRADGRADYLVRLTLTNTAPADAATALPWVVTGGGIYGVPPGVVETNVAVYVPTGSVIVGARSAGAYLSLQRATSASRPVGQFRTSLAPGATATYDLQFVGPAARPGVTPHALRVATTPGVTPTPIGRATFACDDVMK